MKYFVGTAVGKKDINSVEKRSWDCMGRCNIDFFFFIHVGNAMLVLSLFILCFYSACGKNLLNFTPVSCYRGTLNNSFV